MSELIEQRELMQVKLVLSIVYLCSIYSYLLSFSKKKHH